MRYIIKTEIKTYSYSIYFELDENPISLSYDGENTYKSTDFVNMPDNSLDLFFRANGLNGTDWGIELVITKEGDTSYEKKFKKTGSILSRGTSKHIDKINL